MSTKDKTSKEKTRLDINAIILALIGLVGTIIVALFSYLGSKNSAPSTPIPSPSPTFTTPSMIVASPTLLPVATLPIVLNTPCAEKSSTRYGFDCGMPPWTVPNDPGSRAVTEITTTEKVNAQGIRTTVLALTVNFIGTPTDRLGNNRNKGEAQVNLSDFPPTGYAHGTVNDLLGKTITAMVWASKGSKGAPDHMNGFQLFIRDQKDKSCYGDWKNIESEEVWFRIVWKEPSMDEKQADKDKCDPDFDISNPKILGLKIAVGDNSTIVYDAPLTIYLDDIDWQ